MAHVVHDLEAFVLTRIQHAIDKCDWSSLRLMFGFFDCEFPARAKELYDKMPDNIKEQLFTYKKNHDTR